MKNSNNMQGGVLMAGLGLPSARGLFIGILTLIFGITVMIFPKILNYLIGIYLVIIGLWGIVTAL
jgi:uncharacterized membrane protein HdeD (DUF308 family)